MVSTYGKTNLFDKFKMKYGKKGHISINRSIERYGHAIKITQGFVAGTILDTIIPMTFFIPTIIFKKFGKVLGYKRLELKNKGKISKVMNWIMKMFLVEKEDNKIRW